MNTYAIYIKSHCEAPDYEATVQADKFIEAANKFYEMLEGEYDLEFIKEHMYE